MAKKGWNIRRHHKNRIYKKRLKRQYLNWLRFEDANGNILQDIHWVDLINHPSYLCLKSITTDRYDSRYKIKYSPNKNKHRSCRNKNGSTSLREKDKVLYKKEIENGIIEYGECY